jgi:methionyl-tRNA formyltransferase
MGTPAFAATALAALIDAGHDIAAVYTQPPRPANRGKQLAQSPVQLLAEAHGLPVRTPVKLRDATDQQDFADLKLDVAVVAAYGLILPQAILDAPRFGCLNIHASLLPRWRGAAPIHRAIMAGDAQSGICIMQMEAGLDTGPVLLREAMDIEDDDTTPTLHDKLATLGAQMCVAALRQLDRLVAMPQPADGISYAHKIEKAEARLDFTQDAITLERYVRALAPYPGAYIELGGERIKILQAQVGALDGKHPGTIMNAQFDIACGSNQSLRPVMLQRAGKQPVAIDDFLRGFDLPVGECLA